MAGRELPNLLVERDGDLIDTFGERKLLVYHLSRLLAHEIDAVGTDGLRVRDDRLVTDKLNAAATSGALVGDALRRASHHASLMRAVGDLDGTVRFVLGRSALEDLIGCAPLLKHWGGEALRGGPVDCPELTALGTPTIVVARIPGFSPARPAQFHPSLAKLFAGVLLDAHDRWGEVVSFDPVSGQDILALWQPGDPDYDRHAGLPR